MGYGTVFLLLFSIGMLCWNIALIVAASRAGSDTEQKLSDLKKDLEYQISKIRKIRSIIDGEK